MPTSLQILGRSSEPVSSVRVLTILQVALVMIFGNCSFGIPLLAAIAWPADRFDLAPDPLGFAVPSAWAVGLIAISTYAYLTNRWAARADRRARAAIITGTAVLVGLTTIALPIAEWDRSAVVYILLTAAPSLIIQAVVLRHVYGPAGRRWFAGGGK